MHVDEKLFNCQLVYTLQIARYPILFTTSVLKTLLKHFWHNLMSNRLTP